MSPLSGHVGGWDAGCHMKPPLKKRLFLVERPIVIYVPGGDLFFEFLNFREKKISKISVFFLPPKKGGKKEEKKNLRPPEWP